MMKMAKALPPLLVLALLQACLNTGQDRADETTSGGIDTEPQGPAFSVTEVSGERPTVAHARAEGRYEVTFPASEGNPSALFSFAETEINDRLGIALDVSNGGSHAPRVYADLNQDTWVRGYVTVPAGKTRTLCGDRGRGQGHWPPDLRAAHRPKLASGADG